MPVDWKQENAQHFEAHVRETLQPLYQWFLKDIELAAGRAVVALDILDIGCGPGFMLETLKKAGAGSVTGIDLSFSMLAAAAESGRGKEARLIQADAASLPLMPASYDIVFSRGSIFFWKNLEKSLQQISCCLKADGMAILGGGYGLSTPQALVDAVRNDHCSKSSIPRIDLDHLCTIAENIGGKVSVKSAPRRGFWLIWRPHC